MNPRNPQARHRLVVAASDMLRRRGLHATSIRDLAKHADAPLGSTYHYFPGGKPQLVKEALHHAGGTIHEILRRKLEAGPVEGLLAFIALWRETLTSSDFQAGCPVLAVAAEEASDDDGHRLLETAAAVFSGWEELLAETLMRHGTDTRKACDLAILVVAAVEGATILCRAKHDPGPLDAVGRQLEALLTANAANSRGSVPNDA